MTTDELYMTLENGNFSAIKEADTEDLWDFALNPVASWGTFDRSVLKRVMRELYSRYGHAHRPEEESEDENAE